MFKLWLLFSILGVLTYFGSVQVLWFTLPIGGYALMNGCSLLRFTDE